MPLENEVTRLKAELENEKRKSAKAVVPQQPTQQTQQPTQPAQQNQQELVDLKNSLNKVTQERDSIYNNLANAEGYIEKLLQ